LRKIIDESFVHTVQGHVQPFTRVARAELIPGIGYQKRTLAIHG